MHVPPPLIALVLGALMKTIAWVTPDLVITHPLLRPTAFVLILTGIGVAATGVAQFRLNKTTVNPLQPEKASTLVTSGIYRITRNPMYLGLLSFLLAWSL
ncbi:MAG: methyltransferase [Pseudomonadota bacterium]